eukprot:COSAG04_NODE_19030_length_426_cov_1.278287_1_plen_65_part_00
MRTAANLNSITIADSTFCYLAGVDPEDPNTVGTHSDGTKYRLPGIDSINMVRATLPSSSAPSPR